MVTNNRCEAEQIVGDKVENIVMDSAKQDVTVDKRENRESVVTGGVRVEGFGKVGQKENSWNVG